MLSFVVASALSGVLWADEARDWEFRAGRFETVGAAVSKELGKPVDVHEVLRDELVIGRFAGKTSEAMMSAFGKGTMTVWTEENGRIVVRPDGKAREEWAKQRRVERRAAVERSVTRALAADISNDSLDRAIKNAIELQKKYSETEEYDYQTYQKLDRVHPGNRLAAMFVKEAIDEIVNAPDNQQVRRVFSLNPTRYQKGLGSFGNSLILEAQRGARSLTAALDRNGVADNQEGIYLNMLQRPQGEKPIVRVRASLSLQGDYVNATVECFDEDGSQVMMGNMNVGLTYDMEMAMDQEPNEADKAPENPYSKYQSTVPVDEMDFALMSALYSWSNANAKQASEEDRLAILKSFADVMEHDFLERTATSVMFALSKESKKDICGHIGDRWMLGSQMDPRAGLTKEIKLSDSLRWWTMDQSPTHTEDEGTFWLKEFGRSRMFSGFERRSLAYLSSEVIKKRALSFDALAQAALMCSNEQEYMITKMIVLGLIGRNPNPMMMGGMDGDYRTLRIYASLPADIRSQLKAGPVTIPASRLTAKAQAELLEDLIFEPYSISFGEPYQPGIAHAETLSPPEQDSALERMQNLLAEKLKEDFSEPTVFMTLAEATPVLLEFSIGPKTEYVGQRQNNYFPSETTIEELAQHQALAEAAQAQGVVEAYYQPYTGFMKSESSRLGIKVKLGEYWSRIFEAKISSDDKAEYLPLEKMPKDFQDAYGKALEQARKDYQGVQFGSEGRGTKVIKP